MFSSSSFQLLFIACCFRAAECLLHLSGLSFCFFSSEETLARNALSARNIFFSPSLGRNTAWGHCPLVVGKSIFLSRVGDAVPVGMGMVPDDDVAEMVRAVRMYFGDHIDWAELQQFNMPELYDSKDIARESIKIADEIQEDIEFHSTPPIEEFFFPDPFTPPLNAQNMWNTEIALGSAAVMIPLDQINIFMNGGNLSVDSYQYDYRADRALQLLRTLSEMEQSLDNTFYQTLPMMLMYQRQTILSYLDMISSQASCLYDILEARNSSASRVFIKNVEKEHFVLFVTEFAGTLKKLVMSEKTVGMIQMFYKMLKSKIKSYDHDSLSTEMYSTFIKARNLLLKVDIEGLFEHLNDIHYTIAESVWKLKTGQWPELAKFVDNFFRKTYGSREFWVRLGTLSDWIYGYLF